MSAIGPVSGAGLETAATSPNGAPPSIRDLVLRGAFGSIAAGVAVKVATFIAQVVLARYLLPADFGMVAIASAVAGFVSIVAASGFTDALLRRSDEEWGPLIAQSWWLALCLSLAASAMLVAAIPIATDRCGSSALGWMMLILAVQWPLTIPSAIASARLKRNLRFGAINVAQVVFSLLQSGGAIVLAMHGWGPLSLLLPNLVCVLASWIVIRRSAGPNPISTPRPSAWKAQLPAIAWTMLVALIGIAQTHGPSLVLGVSAGIREVGLFSWSMMVATQAIFLLSSNLRTLLTAALVKLDADRERQWGACCRISVAMTAVIGPVCLAQALVAKPLIGIIFGDRWLDAAPIVSWLSLGLLAQPMSIVASVVFVAQGRLRRAIYQSAIQCILFLACSTIGALAGGASGAALGGACATFASGAWSATAIARSFDRRWWEPGRLLGRALPVTVVAGLAGLGASQVSAGAGAGVQSLACLAAIMIIAASATWAWVPEVRSLLRRGTASR